MIIVTYSSYLQRQEWKAGSAKRFGPGVRVYDPVPPALNSIDLANFQLKLAGLKVKQSSAEKGWGKYEVTLANEIRARHANSAVFAAQWRALVLEFDKKLLGACYMG